MTRSTLHYATLWEAIADRIPDSPALAHGAQAVTWAGFDDRSSRLASALHAAGISHGDGVAECLYNRPEHFEIFFAALKIRAVPSNINYRYGGDELAALLENSGAKVLFYDAALREKVASVVDRASGVRLLVEVGAASGLPLPVAIPYEELVAGFDPAPRIARDGDDVFLSYTGGTTGLPKGVLFNIGRSVERSLRFRDVFLDNPYPTEPVGFAAELGRLGSPMSAIPASPLMHSTGFLFTAMPTLVAGGVVTTLEGRSFDPHELLRTVERAAARLVAIVGDAFALPIVRALDEARAAGTRHDLSSLRVIVSAGVPWSAPIKERLLEHLPLATLLDSCGTTEGVGYGMRSTRRGDPLATANFDASPGVKVLAPDRTELPLGEIGLLAGPTAASGYHRDPEATALTFFRIGAQQYAAPGDLGRLETDGTVTLIGRGTATINTGGEKVYPAEVAETINTLAGVDDCLVVGIPDERFGQVVAALVVVAAGGGITADHVVAVVREAHAGYKTPRRVRLVDAVPRLQNGKIDYEAAVALAQGGSPILPSAR